jgi:hypothetical protein
MQKKLDITRIPREVLELTLTLTLKKIVHPDTGRQ